MRTADGILQDAATKQYPLDAESKRDLARFSRTRYVELVRSLSVVSGYRTTAYLMLQWGIMIASLAMATHFDHWLVYFIALLIIASRMQALGVMVHDGAHWLLYRNRQVNDAVCDLFIAFPLGMSTTLYRKTHFRHHRYTNTSEDQDLAAQKEEREWYQWPKSRWGFVWVLFRSAFGLNTHRAWILYKHWTPWNNFRSPDFPKQSRLLYVLSMICVYSFFAWALQVNTRVTLILMGVYMISGYTILNLTNRLRATAEHLGTPGTHELNDTRTVIPSLMERFFIAPYGVNFHLEHHLFPSVPGYRLGKLHRELMKDDEFRNQAHVTQHYTGVLRELMSQPSLSVRGEATFPK